MGQGLCRFKPHAQMLTSVQQEQHLLGARVDVVIVLEFHQQKELVPIILMLIDKDSEVLLQLLVDALHLSIHLWVVSGSRQQCDICHKLQAPIGDDVAWKFMQFSDIV